jgi:hypothetical protein
MQIWTLPRPIITIFLLLAFGSSAGAAEPIFDHYRRPEERIAVLKEMAAANPGITRMHVLAKSPGGSDLTILEIGPETNKERKSFPSIFVAADMEGTVPISGEAALYIAKLVLENVEVRADRSWYILPCGNPDAAARFFTKPLFRDARNATPVNDDRDEATDEDGPEDLNGDGFVTQMRVKDPTGEWMPTEENPRLLKKADVSKGEKGLYKIYQEGIDNDGDGRYNEDGPGGVDIGITFPHLFKYFEPERGLWPGSEKETYALFRFFDTHREIALTFVFGETNFCLVPPRGGRKGESDLNRIRIPENVAGALNADPNKTYTMAEIMDLVRVLLPPGAEPDEARTASLLGLGAVVNPLEEDLKFYRELSEKYKEYLKTKKLDAKRLEPAQDKDGSFELWSYYQLGVPSFSLDFWTPPEVKKEKAEDEIAPEKLEKMSNDDFVALGEDKVNALLKSIGAPAQLDAKKVFEAFASGTMDTKRMAEMLKQMPKPPAEQGADPREKALLAWSDEELDGKGFVEWQPFQHPSLGEVEIGGFVPFAENSPPPAMIEDLLEGQVPWVLEVSKKMARIRIAKTKVEPLGAGLYEVKVWVENAGMLPYPTAMGQRNRRILPVIISLNGDDFKVIGGKRRSLVASIPGQSSREVGWILQADKPLKIDVRAETQCAWSDSRTISLGGE